MTRHSSAAVVLHQPSFAGVMLLVLILAAAALSPALADGRGRTFDNRYAHNQYYPARGYRAPALPPHPYPVHYHGSAFYYTGGVWYRPAGPRFVVVAPPIGVAVPILPPYFTTVWFAGVPYYYANNVYYRWAPSQSSYIVTDPPGAPDSATTTQPDQGDIYAYPARGQSTDTQARDRYECHRWAADQTGFDPTQPLGGVAASQSTARRADYQRAETACLEARSYTVR